MATVVGGLKLKEALSAIRKRVEEGRSVSVGFMSNAKYPDGTPVAMVAAIHNYGAPGAGIPARPFFSNMVADESPNWGPQLGKLLKTGGFDAVTALSQMGELIAGELRQSIIYGDWQPLSETTLMLRTMRSKGATVTGRTVGQATKAVAMGMPNDRSETGAKPLVDTGHMLNSITYRVNYESE